VILEVALLTIRPGMEGAFERAFAKAERLISDAPGYLSHELRRSLERGHHYALLVEWRRVEDHTLGFVRSRAYEHLRALLSDHLLTPPDVEYFGAVPTDPAAPTALAD
jgi:heme-degrading monooxygenase HmoA